MPHQEGAKQHALGGTEIAYGPITPTMGGLLIPMLSGDLLLVETSSGPWSAESDGPPYYISRVGSNTAPILVDVGASRLIEHGGAYRVIAQMPDVQNVLVRVKRVDDGQTIRLRLIVP